jgi:N-acyl amino acid synthase of PEP-CTERM/exosortase system
MTERFVSARRRGRRPAQTRFVEAAALAEQYQRYFEPLLANTASLRAAAYHLRYQVLCEERGLLEAKNYPEQREQDHYDTRARQAVLFYRPDRRLIGTMRLILPSAKEPLPSLLQCPELAANIITGKTAELSRFLLSRDFRRRWNDGDYGTTNPWLAGDNQRRIPHIGIGLLKIITATARRDDISHVVALAEPAMLRLMAGLGLHFAPVGGLIDHVGLRQPCYAKIENLLSRLQQERPEIWHYLTSN